jgi:hypothetical protein
VLRGGTARIAHDDGERLGDYFVSRHAEGGRGFSNVEARVERRGYCGWAPTQPSGGAARRSHHRFLSSIAHSAALEGDTAPVEAIAVMTRLSQGAALGRCVAPPPTRLASQLLRAAARARGRSRTYPSPLPFPRTLRTAADWSEGLHARREKLWFHHRKCGMSEDEREERAEQLTTLSAAYNER